MDQRMSALRCSFLIALVISSFIFPSCSYRNQSFRDAEVALKNKNWDVAVAEYSRALVADPNNPEIKMKLNMSKVFASRWHYEEAKRRLEEDKLQEAVMELALATDLDPENKTAAEEYDRVKKIIENRIPAPQPEVPVERPVSELPSVALQPEFNPRPGVSIELKFKDTLLKEVLLTLGKLGDVNVLFDKDFKDMPVSFDFHNTTFIQSLDTVLTSTHNFYKVIGKNTIMIAPDNPQKRAEYEETVSRTFFLSNAEVEEIARTLRNVLGIQMVATNVRLNSVTVKDRITRVLAAEKIVQQLDKGKPEVVVDVEILEINRSRLQQYGLHIHSPGEDGITTTLGTDPEKLRIEPGPVVSRSNFFITNFPQATLRLLKSTSDSKLLANLPLRTVVGETGRVRFGNQVPVPQTTFAPIATGGVNQQPITSFIYKDVGINIDITPRVHRNREVTLEVIIESSAISGSGFGNLPQFSTSRVEKTIRLKEGETNIIAGLIRDEERKALMGIPGFAEIPFVGKLFASNETEVRETDVVLALSPHVLRNMTISSDDEKMLWLGIEEQQGSTYRPYSPVPALPPTYEEDVPEEQPEEIPEEEVIEEPEEEPPTNFRF
jgi:general secretion pathway protein D